MTVVNFAVTCMSFSFLGGIFHGDNYESEIAFRYSLERVNMHEKNFEFEPLIRHVSPTDSFKAERISD